jgi:hypothetical protein
VPINFMMTSETKDARSVIRRPSLSAAGAFSLRRFSGFGMPLALLLTAGCSGGGSGLVAVEGDAKVDGQAADGAILLFHPQSGTGPVSTAVANAAGHFSVVTEMQPGIPVGTYKVTATWPAPLPADFKMSMSGPPDQPDRLKGRYVAKDKSNMTVEVKADSKVLPPLEMTTK